MWLYMNPPGTLKGIVSDEFAYSFAFDPSFLVVTVGEDLNIWILAAVFQPLNEYQLALF